MFTAISKKKCNYYLLCKYFTANTNAIICKFVTVRTESASS